MRKRLFFTIIATFIGFIFTSFSSSFENNKENFNKQTREHLSYSLENINSGNLKGGHDTIISEGLLLKENVHKELNPDGGIDFKNKNQ